MISESDGFESICGDSVCESYHSSDEEDSDEDIKMKSVKSLDSDGFEEVVQK